MSLVRPVVYDGGLQRQTFPGDVLAGGEALNALTTAGAGTLTAALMISGIINRTGPGGAYNDTTDTAQNIINALVAPYPFGQTGNTGISSGVAVPNGLTFRLKHINTVAFVMTMVAGTGVTLVGTTTIAASSIKDYLVTVTNGSPTQVFAVTTTNGSAVITGMTQFQTAALSVGMTLTGTGVSGTIISIQPGVGVTASANASATGTLVSVSFGPTVSITSIGQMLL